MADGGAGKAFQSSCFCDSKGSKQWRFVDRWRYDLGISPAFITRSFAVRRHGREHSAQSRWSFRSQHQTYHAGNCCTSHSISQRLSERSDRPAHRGHGEGRRSGPGHQRRRHPQIPITEDDLVNWVRASRSGGRGASFEDQNQRRRARAPTPLAPAPFLDTHSHGLYSLGYFLENLLFRACFRGFRGTIQQRGGVPDVHRNPRT
jgi:hypothetical protein